MRTRQQGPVGATPGAYKSASTGRPWRRGVVLAVSVFAAAAALAGGPDEPLPEAVERAARSLVVLTAANGAAGAVGAGVVVHRSGLVVTTDHVAAAGPAIQVRTPDGVQPAQSLARHPGLDLHLSHVEDAGVAPLEGPVRSHIGADEAVWALGASRAAARSGRVVERERRAPSLLPGTPLVSSDIALAHGDSGGILVDEAGRLAGLLIATRGDGASARSLAIPPGAIRAFIEQVLRREPPALGWLGLDLARRHAHERGLSVISVAPGSPADAAGVTAGTRVVALDGERVRDPHRFAARVARKRPGTRVRLALADSRGERRLRVGRLAQPASHPWRQ
jgi:S1-C subfamily serine protease